MLKDDGAARSVAHEQKGLVGPERVKDKVTRDIEPTNLRKSQQMSTKTNARTSSFPSGASATQPFSHSCIWHPREL